MQRGDANDDASRAGIGARSRPDEARRVVAHVFRCVWLGPFFEAVPLCLSYDEYNTWTRLKEERFCIVHAGMSVGCMHAQRPSTR